MSTKTEIAPATGKYHNMLPEELRTVGLDTPVPPTDAHPGLLKIFQPERNSEIERLGSTDDLEAAIEAVGEVIQPVTAVRLKFPGDDKASLFVTYGRRRKYALARVNARRAAGYASIENERKGIKGDPLPPITLKVIHGDPADPLLWFKVRSENAGRAPDSPFQLSRDVARMRAGDEALGIKPMSYEEVGTIYGRNHQWARAYELLGKASNKVKAALEGGQLSATAAQNLAVLKTHEEQDAALSDAIASGGSTRAATAKVKKTQGQGTGSEVWSTTRMREALRGVSDKLRFLGEQVTEVTEGDTFDVICDIAAYSTLRAVLGENEMDGELWEAIATRYSLPDDFAAEAWLTAVNAQGVGADLMKQDAAKARDAQKSDAQVAKEKEKADAKAAKVAKGAEAAKAKAAKEAEKEVAKAAKEKERTEHAAKIKAEREEKAAAKKVEADAKKKADIDAKVAAHAAKEAAKTQPTASN